MNNLDNIELRSDEVQEILKKVPHWMIRYGNILLLTLIILLFAISWFVKYPDIISGKGFLTTTTPPQKEYAKISGKLNHVFIENGQSVLPNNPLIVFENTADYKDVFYLKSIIDTININKKEFYFPLDSLPILFLGEIDNDFALFEKNYIQYRLNKEYNPFQFDVNTMNISQSELSGRLKTLESQKQIYSKEVEFKKRDLERYKTLYDKGVISSQEYEREQLKYLQTTRNFENIKASISRTREQLRTASNKNEIDNINHTREEIKLLKNVIQSFNKLKTSIINWELRYVIQSKISGEVSFMNFWSENQIVNSGDLVVTIFPDNNRDHIVKIKIPSFNSGKVQIGQKVNIKIVNYPEAEYGFLLGTVNSISSVPNEDDEYLVDVVLPKKLITTYQKEINLNQELLCSADIMTNDFRLIERFFYQFIDVFKR